MDGEALLDDFGLFSDPATIAAITVSSGLQRPCGPVKLTCIRWIARTKINWFADRNQGGTDAPLFGFAVCSYSCIVGVVWDTLGRIAVRLKKCR